MDVEITDSNMDNVIALDSSTDSDSDKTNTNINSSCIDVTQTWTIRFEYGYVDTYGKKCV